MTELVVWVTSRWCRPREVGDQLPHEDEGGAATRPVPAGVSDIPCASDAVVLASPLRSGNLTQRSA